MFVAALLLSLLLALASAASGVMKLRREPRVVEPLAATGVPASWLPRLAAAELAGAVGLVIGLVVAPLGIAAAVGLVLYFVGAEITHLRVRDLAGRPFPLLVLSVAVLATRMLSA